MADFTDILDSWIAVGMPFTVGLAADYRDNDVYIKDRIEKDVTQELMLANLAAWDAPGTTWEPSVVRYGNGRWLLAGLAGNLYTADVPLQLPGVASWTSRTGATTHNGGAHQGGTSSNWVLATASAGSTGVIYSTNNGTTWASANNQLGGAGQEITYADSLWVCVGYHFKISTSPNQTTWTLRYDPSFTGGQANGVTHGAGLFVAVGVDDSGDGMIVTSPDGITWTVQTDHGFGTSDIRSVTYHELSGLFIAVGLDGKIATSSDGIEWSMRASGVSTRLNAVHYATGKAVAVGIDSVVLVSDDGITWHRYVTPHDDDFDYQDVHRAGASMWMLTGDYFTTDVAEIAVSLEEVL